MTRVASNFSQHALSAAPPGEWTSRWASGTWTIASGGDDKILEFRTSTLARYLLSWRSLDHDDNRVNTEMLALLRAPSGSKTGVEAGPGCAIRCSGSSGSENGYVTYLFFDTTTDKIALAKLSSGSATVLATVNKSWSINTWYWWRFRANGTSLKLKMWEKGTAEPASWDIDTTDSTYSSAGWCGLYSRSANYDGDFDFVSAATNGDTALDGAPERYFTDFAEYSTGAKPSDWAERSSGTGVFTAETGGDDKVLDVTLSSDTRSFAIWNQVGQAGDFETLALISPEGAAPTGGYAGPGLVGRVVVASVGSENAYALFLWADSTFSLRLQKYINGTATVLSTVAITASAGSWYWLRWKVVGGSLKARWWAKGSAEPGTWDIDTTDASLADAGSIGVFAFNNVVNGRFDQIGIDVTGGDAPASITGLRKKFMPLLQCG